MKQRLSEEDIARLEERTAEFEGLASLVSFRPEVTLQAGPPIPCPSILCGHCECTGQ